MIDQIKSYEFLESVGLVTACASIITLIFTGIIKLILVRTNVINKNIDPVRKDIILSRIGRVIGLCSYIVFYVIDTVYLKKEAIIFDVKLITSLLSGGSLTLVTAKGLYTMIRQSEKKNDVYTKLEKAQYTIEGLNKKIIKYEAIGNNNHVKANNEEISFWKEDK